MIDPNTVLEALAAVVTAIGGLYGVLKHVNARIHKKREKYRSEILLEAKEEARIVKESLEIKIGKIEAELKTKQDLLEKDLLHTKEIYNQEVRVLGERIQELRDDISTQHANLVALLTKLVNR